MQQIINMAKVSVAALNECDLLQVAGMPQTSGDSWSAQTVTYTSTSHSGVSYRPSSSCSRPSTAHPVTPQATNHTPRRRPTSAHVQTAKPVCGHTLPQRPMSSLSAAIAVSGLDTAHLDITQLVHSKAQQQLGQRPVSPFSGGSTCVTPSPAHTPSSVLSRPGTAGKGGWNHAVCAC